MIFDCLDKGKSFDYLSEKNREDWDDKTVKEVISHLLKRAKGKVTLENGI